jgi:RNA polymerase sigma-70 factor (ECF subfamily)
LEEDVFRWYPRLYRTALRLTGDPHDAADLTQQAFSQALGAWERFERGSLRTTWLHQILVNCVRDWARRSAVRAGVPFDPWGLHVAARADGDGLEALEAQEQLAALRQAVESLPDPCRQAFVVTVLDGYTYGQAAEMLGVPKGTVASRVNQARMRLHAVMRQAFGET